MQTSTTNIWRKEGPQKEKTYNSGYSLVVTHLTTNPPVRCLNRAERTGSLVFNVLWSYVKDMLRNAHYMLRNRALTVYHPSAETPGTF
jgi:hypothetical protein